MYIYATLFFVCAEQGEIVAVLKEYDTILVHAVKPDNRLGLLDASSLLWRLNLMGVDTGNRWQRVTDAFRDHIGQHGSTWYVERGEGRGEGGEREGEGEGEGDSSPSLL